MKKNFTAVLNLFLILIFLPFVNAFASYVKCSSSSVVSYQPGKDKSGNVLPSEKTDPAKALGEVESTPGINYVSLGFGGEITLYFNKGVFNGTNKDFSVVAFNEAQTCNSNPRKAEIFVSKDNISWFSVGEACLSTAFELPSQLGYFQYVKVVDISNPEDFAAPDAEGFNLNAVVSNYCDVLPQPLNPLIPLLKCIDEKSDGSYTAYFGYKNENPYEVTIEVGVNNKFTSGGSENMGQVTKFLANTTIENAFSVTVPANVVVSWSLKGPDGAVRSITATKNSSTCNVRLPSANVRGGGAICEGEEATVYVDLVGKAPWSVVYKGSDNVEITVENILATPYSFQVNKATTISLVSVSNPDGIGTVSGSAIVTKKPAPQALIQGEEEICEGEKAEIKVVLTGQAPFSFGYSNLDGTEAVQVNNHLSNQYSIEVADTRKLKLISVQDAGCAGTVAGSASVTAKEVPKANISGDKAICDGDKATISVKLSGVAPFSFSYSEADGKNLKSITDYADVEYTFEVAEAKQYKLLTLTDATTCSGIVSGVATVIRKPAPTATISGDTEMCSGEKATIKVELTGEAPFTFAYSEYGSTNTFTIDGYKEKSYSFEASRSSLFQMVSVSDAQCKGIVSGTARVQIKSAPVAWLDVSDDDFGFCEGDKPTIRVNLEGTKPFSYTLSAAGSSTTFSNFVEDYYDIDASLSGTYRITNLSDAVCSGGDAEVTIYKRDFYAELALKDIYCFGDQVEIKPEIQTNTPLLVSWSTSGKGKLKGSFPYDATYIPNEESGLVTIELALTSECATKKYSWQIKYDEKIDTSFTNNPDKEIYPTQPIALFANEDNVERYLWEYGMGEKDSTQNPIINFDSPGENLVILKLERNGCIAYGYKVIEVLDKRDLYIPNIFNPSALHVENRVVKVYGSDISPDEFSFVIFNKWGNILYKTTDFYTANNVGWNGVESGGETQALGVYTYVVKGKYNDGKKFNKSGTITLAR